MKKDDPRIEVVLLDITDWNKTNQVLENIGPIDLLVNNAGLGWLKPMTEIIEEDLDRYVLISAHLINYFFSLVF